MKSLGVKTVAGMSTGNKFVRCSAFLKKKKKMVSGQAGLIERLLFSPRVM